MDCIWENLTYFVVTKATWGKEGILIPFDFLVVKKVVKSICGMGTQLEMSFYSELLGEWMDS